MIEGRVGERHSLDCMTNWQLDGAHLLERVWLGRNGTAGDVSNKMWSSMESNECMMHSIMPLTEEGAYT